MADSYESYAAHCHAQLVTPASRESWIRDCELAKSHTVDFTVTQEMAKRGNLASGQYRNHFGNNQQLIQTVRIDKGAAISCNWNSVP